MQTFWREVLNFSRITIEGKILSLYNIVPISIYILFLLSLYVIFLLNNDVIILPLIFRILRNVKNHPLIYPLYLLDFIKNLIILPSIILK